MGSEGLSLRTLQRRSRLPRADMLSGRVAGIRPLQPDDLEEVVALFDRVMQPGATSVGLQGLFRRVLLEHPWFDSEIPSLVYADGAGRIVGFMAAHVRRMRLGDRPVRVAYCGQWVVAPEARLPIGALLLARMLAGPQDATLSDTGSARARAIFSRLGTHTLPLQSLQWVQVVRVPPPSWYAAWLSGRALPGSLPKMTSRLATALEPLDRWYPPPRRHAEQTEVTDEPLTAEAMVQLLPRFGRSRLRPDYDLPFARWLLREMGAVVEMGPLSARLVRKAGEPIGWHLSYMATGGHVYALQTIASPDNAATVLDACLAHARRRGAAIVAGRLDPWLFGAITRRARILCRGPYVLVHSRDDEFLHAVLTGDSVFTQADGEWWVRAKGL